MIEIRKTDQTSSIGWQAAKSVLWDFFFAIGFMILGGVAMLAILSLTGGRQ